MPYRIVPVGLVAAALVLCQLASASAQAPDFPSGADTAGRAPPSEIMLRAAPLMQAGQGEEPKFSLVLSRADAPDARRDRVQVIATATYDLER